MRPRSDDRGNSRPASSHASAKAASMRPRSDDRGNDSVLGDRPPVLVASMRPRSDDRGNCRDVLAAGGVDVRFNEAAVG